MGHPLARRGKMLFYIGVRKGGEVVDAEVEARGAFENMLLGALKESRAHHRVIGDRLPHRLLEAPRFHLPVEFEVEVRGDVAPFEDIPSADPICELQIVERKCSWSRFGHGLALSGSGFCFGRADATDRTMADQIHHRQFDSDRL